MQVDISTIRILELLAYPPAGSLLLMALGAILSVRWKRTARALVLLGILSLYMAATPFFANCLVSSLETSPALTPQAMADARAEAIVVLGADRYRNAPEYGGDTSNAAELERVRYAAALHRATGLPIATLGGDFLDPRPDGMETMVAVLEEEFLVPVRYRDGRSRNTLDNARNARELLHPLGLRRVFLVTHALHMPRAMAAFTAHGFDPVPAPTGFHAGPQLEEGWLVFVPRDSALTATRRALHEFIGLLWFRLAYGADVAG